MVIIISLWLIYLNKNLPSFVEKPPSKEENSLKETFSTFKKGFEEIIGEAKKQFEFLREFTEKQLQKSNQLEIQKDNLQEPSVEFPLKDLENQNQP